MTTERRGARKGALTAAITSVSGRPKTRQDKADKVRTQGRRDIYIFETVLASEVFFVDI